MYMSMAGSHIPLAERLKTKPRVRIPPWMPKVTTRMNADNPLMSCRFRAGVSEEMED